MKDYSEVNALIKLHDSFLDLVDQAVDGEYPDNTFKHSVPFKDAIKEKIIDKDGKILFQIFHNKREEGSDHEILFDDSYGWDNEEYKGDGNFMAYAQVATNALYLAYKKVYDSWPEEVQMFYKDALFDELQYSTDKKSYTNFKTDWVNNYTFIKKDKIKEEDKLNKLLDQYEKEVKTLLYNKDNGAFIFE